MPTRAGASTVVKKGCNGLSVVYEKSLAEIPARIAGGINGGKSYLTRSTVCSSPLCSHFSLHYLTIPSPVLLHHNDDLCYSDGAIDGFVNSNTTITRQQCDEFAISSAGGVSTALQMQGVV